MLVLEGGEFMRKIKAVRAYLGKPYYIREINGVGVIFRKFSSGYEFEISGFYGEKGFSLSIWQRSPNNELLNIYTGIDSRLELKDLLGHCAFSLENLREKIQVEREDLKL